MKLFTILLSTILLFSSCSVVHKVFHHNKSQIDSSYVTKQKSDSLTKVDSSSLHKENTTTVTKSDSLKTDEQTTINEHTVVKEFNDSGKVKKETVIDKKTVTNKGTQSGSLTVFENAGKIDSSGWSKLNQASKESVDSGHFQKKEKEVSREVSKKKLPILNLILLGLIVLSSIWAYKNRSKVKKFFVNLWPIIRHFLTGL